MFVFSAQAGVNLWLDGSTRLKERIPRASGGEPEPQDKEAKMREYSPRSGGEPAYPSTEGWRDRYSPRKRG